MAKVRRVLNVTNGFWFKPGLVDLAIEQCAVAWVDRGVSVRNVTEDEAVVLRNQQAQQRMRLAYAELPGLVYEPAIGGAEAYRNERLLAVEANNFASQC